MSIRLSKHHGLGNDFLVLLTEDDLGADEPWADKARRWCERHRGIGADGLLLGQFGRPGTDLVMRLYNADGSRAEMSGNGIRCLVHADARRRAEPSGGLVVSTDGGDRAVTYRAIEGDLSEIVASVDMGPARPGPSPDRDLVGPTAVAGDTSAAGWTDLGTFDLGNPHLVLLMEDLVGADLVQVGMGNEARFDAGMNVHLVALTEGEPDAITMRVWERGAGVTEACGTGATAVARAVHDRGLVGPKVTVHMPGGDVVVDVGETMILHGPAVHVADVEVPR